MLKCTIFNDTRYTYLYFLHGYDNEFRIGIRGYIDRGKFVANFASKIWTTFIGQFIHPVGEGDGGKWVDGEYHYFSQLRASLYQST